MTERLTVTYRSRQYVVTTEAEIYALVASLEAVAA